MIDVEFFKKNPELVALKSKQKGYEIDTAHIISLDENRRKLLNEVDNLRKRRNELSNLGKDFNKDKLKISEAKEIKTSLSKLEEELKSSETIFYNEFKKIPNVSLDDVPIGSSEADNVVVREIGVIKKFDFEPKQHNELADVLDLIDTKRAVKISGSRFAYLKNDLVRLQFAIISFVMDSLTNEEIILKNKLNITSKPFSLVLPPAMIKTEPYVASARLNAEEMTYKIEQDDLWLNASAEHSLCTMYWNEIIPEEALPIRYLGYSTSFRREAGTYGKDTEGIFRMHQFDKLEMEVFSKPEDGLSEHLLLIAIQEHLMQQLGLPYRVIRKSTFDIGKPNATGVDIEVWLPGQKKYRETHTADYLTDYQSRDLMIRSKKVNASIPTLVHTNDATAFALGRILIAILENYQLKDGSIEIPSALIPYMMGKTKIQ